MKVMNEEERKRFCEIITEWTGRNIGQLNTDEELFVRDNGDLELRTKSRDSRIFDICVYRVKFDDKNVLNVVNNWYYGTRVYSAPLVMEDHRNHC
jgi:hypothetical protein